MWPNQPGQVWLALPLEYVEGVRRKWPSGEVSNEQKEDNCILFMLIKCLSWSQAPHLPDPTKKGWS